MRLCDRCRAVAAPGRSRCWPCYYSYRRGEEVVELGARTLFIDIETSPNIVLAWDSQLRYGNIGPHQIDEPTKMICFAAKWQGSDEVIFHAEWDTYCMAEAAQDLLDEADVVVHYNGKSFDVPHLNREMWQADLFPPSPFKQVDLCNAGRKMFRFPSHKLQYITTQIGLAGKEDTGGFELWRGVLQGNEEARAKMESYNRQDTVLTEELYNRMLPWIPNLPNWNLYSGGNGCAACGSDEVKEAGVYRTYLSEYLQYQCESCGYWMRGKNRIGGTDLRGVIG